MHDYQVSCLHECQMAIMRAYEVASIHVSKACYINMYQSIEEPFQFNANLRHTLVTLVLIASTFQHLISLSILSYFLLLILFFILNLSLAMAMTIVEVEWHIINFKTWLIHAIGLLMTPDPNLHLPNLDWGLWCHLSSMSTALRCYVCGG